MQAGELVQAAEQKLRPQDLALLAAVGIARVEVRRKLRVAVISTGDEIVPVSQIATDVQIYDANRPMLLDAIRAWGFDAIDLGHVADDADLIADAFDRGAQQADAILTSGGEIGRASCRERV